MLAKMWEEKSMPELKAELQRRLAELFPGKSFTNDLLSSTTGDLLRAQLHKEISSDDLLNSTVQFQKLYEAHNLWSGLYWLNPRKQ